MMLPSFEAGRTTSTVGFFECGHTVLANWVLDGFGPTWAKRRPDWSTLADASADLTPGGRGRTRIACVPIAEWTLMLTNGPHGTDLGLIPTDAAHELGCRAIRAVRVERGGGLYPARILAVYGPAGKPRRDNAERVITAANDGGRWVFQSSGEPYPFEDLSAYQRRIKSQRFTGEMLDSYLRELGVPVDVEPSWADAILLVRDPEDFS